MTLASGGHCRELTALRADLIALEQRYQADLAKLQAQLDQERLERRLWQNRVDSEAMVA